MKNVKTKMNNIYGEKKTKGVAFSTEKCFVIMNISGNQKFVI